jgi:hypothetical protein
MVRLEDDRIDKTRYEKDEDVDDDSVRITVDQTESIIDRDDLCVKYDGRQWWS